MCRGPEGDTSGPKMQQNVVAAAPRIDYMNPTAQRPTSDQPSAAAAARQAESTPAPASYGAVVEERCEPCRAWSNDGYDDPRDTRYLNGAESTDPDAKNYQDVSPMVTLETATMRLPA